MTFTQSMVARVTRLILGGAFLIFGLNGFLQFIPMPPAGGEAGAFLGALASTGYMFPFIKGTEVVVGVLLLLGLYVPLALTVLAPVTLNILAYHLFLEPAGTLLPLFLAALQIHLAYQYRGAFRPLLARRAPLAQSSSKRMEGVPVPAE